MFTKYIVDVKNYIFCEMIKAINIKFHLVSLVTFLFIFSSCSENDASQAKEGVRLMALDSIRLDILEPLSAYDYLAEEGIFLLGDVADAMSVMLPPGASLEGNKVGFVTLNSKGQILGKFNNTGEGPVNHGIGSSSNLLLEKDRIGVMSRRGFYIYDFTGNLIDQVPTIHSRSLIVGPYIRMGAFANGKLALGYTTLTREAYENQDNPYPYMTSFKIFDLEKAMASDDDQASIISSYGYPEGSADETIVFNDIPLITLNRKAGILNVLFAKFKQLKQYRLTDGELLNSINLNPANFHSGNEPSMPTNSKEYYSWLRNGGELLNSKFYEMIQLGEYTLIRYNSALQSSQIEQLVSTGGPTESPVWEGIRDTAYKFYYLLVKDGEVVKQDFELKNLTPQIGEEFFESTDQLRGQIIGGDDLNSIYVLYNNDYAEERAYKLIVRYALELN